MLSAFNAKIRMNGSLKPLCVRVEMKDVNYVLLGLLLNKSVCLYIVGRGVYVWLERATTTCLLRWDIEGDSAKVNLAQTVQTGENKEETGALGTVGSDSTQPENHRALVLRNHLHPQRWKISFSHFIASLIHSDQYVVTTVPCAHHFGFPQADNI